MYAIYILEKIIKHKQIKHIRDSSPLMNLTCDEALDKISNCKRDEHNKNLLYFEVSANKDFVREVQNESNDTGLSVGVILEREYNRKKEEKHISEQKDLIIKTLTESLEESKIQHANKKQTNRID